MSDHPTSAIILFLSDLFCLSHPRLPPTELGPIRFSDKPDIPFKLLGFTDLSEDDFVYFKTPGGNWVAAAKDDAGRLFMIDQVRGSGGKTLG